MATEYMHGAEYAEVSGIVDVNIKSPLLKESLKKTQDKPYHKKYKHRYWYAKAGIVLCPLINTFLGHSAIVFFGGKLTHGSGSILIDIIGFIFPLFLELGQYSVMQPMNESVAKDGTYDNGELRDFIWMTALIVFLSGFGMYLTMKSSTTLDAPTIIFLSCSGAVGISFLTYHSNLALSSFAIKTEKWIAENKHRLSPDLQIVFDGDRFDEQKRIVVHKHKESKPESKRIQTIEVEGKTIIENPNQTPTDGRHIFNEKKTNKIGFRIGQKRTKGWKKAKRTGVIHVNRMSPPAKKEDTHHEATHAETHGDNRLITDNKEVTRKECPNCNKVFWTTTPNVKHYCSTSCRKQFEYQKNRDMRMAKRQTKKSEVSNA